MSSLGFKLAQTSCQSIVVSLQLNFLSAAYYGRSETKFPKQCPIQNSLFRLSRSCATSKISSWPLCWRESCSTVLKHCCNLPSIMAKAFFLMAKAASFISSQNTAAFPSTNATEFFLRPRRSPCPAFQSRFFCRVWKHGVLCAATARFTLVCQIVYIVIVEFHFV